MKKLIAILFTVCLAYSFGNAQEIKWYDWNEGYELAKQENKKLLVFVHTDWCHVCKRMMDKTFTNEEVISQITNDFIAIKFNVEKKETYLFEGKEYDPMGLASELSDDKCKGIPTTLFVDSKTNKSKMEVGFITPEDFKPFLKKYAKKI